MIPSFLRSLFSKSWPAGVPKLYKGPPEDMVPFLDAEEIERIERLPVLRVICRLGEAPHADDELVVGCSRLLIRNLMLMPGLSVRGPEDCPPPRRGRDLRFDPEAREAYVVVSPRDGEILIHLFAGDDHSLRFAVPVEAIRDAPDTALAQTSRLIGRSFGLDEPEELPEGLRHGQPTAAETLERHGALVLASAKDRGEIEAAWRRDPAYACMLWEVRDDDDGRSAVLLQGFENDPWDPQLCFHLFCALWQGGGFEPWALQFCRRAIELAPGHGKAHMCLPHAAPEQRSLLVHSELAVGLLPGNSFAANNYFNYLQRWGCRDDRMCELARLTLRDNPQDPGGYKRLVGYLLDERRFADAVQVAAALARLYEPPMPARTRYCLQQNPVTRQDLERGWSPYRESLEDLRKLELLARCGEIV